MSDKNFLLIYDSLRFALVRAKSKEEVRRVLGMPDNGFRATMPTEVELPPELEEAILPRTMYTKLIDSDRLFDFYRGLCRADRL